MLTIPTLLPADKRPRPTAPNAQFHVLRRVSSFCYGGSTEPHSMARRRRHPNLAPIIAIAIVVGFAALMRLLEFILEHWLGTLTVVVSMLALIGIGLCLKNQAAKRSRPA